MRKVYEFNELDPKFWVVRTGSGYYNHFDISEGKFKFKTACTIVPGHGGISLRTSRPYSFINNSFSVDFELTEDSYGYVALVFSPEQPVAYSYDSLMFLKLEKVKARTGRVRGGGVMFAHDVELDPEKRSGTLKIENRQGVFSTYIDDKLLTSFQEEFKSGHIYIWLMPALDGFNACRKVEGWIDNFTIEDYETACLHPDLSTLMPTLNSFSTATLYMTFILSFLGIIRGMVPK